MNKLLAADRERSEWELDWDRFESRKLQRPTSNWRVWNDFEEEFNLTNYSAAVGAALRGGNESHALKLAIRAGHTNENALSDLIFFWRHPERDGRSISLEEPNYQKLSQEWLAIRNNQVRPALLTPPPARSPSLTAASKATSYEIRCEVLDNFDFDGDQLKPEHRAKLVTVARNLISQSSVQPASARLIGHTDPVGNDADNLALGKRRAEQVANELRHALERMKHGSTEQIAITVESRGEREPISINPAQNRRVEICLPPDMANSCVITAAPSLESEIPWLSRRKVPYFRACCMLAPPFVDPVNLGQHGSSNEVNGLLYTGRAGFLDLGHIRDSCDMTKYIFDQLSQGATPSKVFAAYGLAGHIGVKTVGQAEMTGCPSSPIDAARAIAYDVGLGHEIVSYPFWKTPGGHNSSFSPEDLCSNFLGTLLAERAIAALGSFNAGVTAELNKLISSLDGQIPSESLKAFNQINGRWVHWIYRASPPSIIRSGYLRRRNFSRNPWKAGHPSDKMTPTYVIAPMPPVGQLYKYTHSEDGSQRPKSGFTSELHRIKQDASSRYGSNYDKP